MYKDSKHYMNSSPHNQSYPYTNQNYRQETVQTSNMGAVQSDVSFKQRKSRFWRFGSSSKNQENNYDYYNKENKANQVYPSTNYNSYQYSVPMDQYSRRNTQQTTYNNSNTNSSNLMYGYDSNMNHQYSQPSQSYLNSYPMENHKSSIRQDQYYTMGVPPEYPSADMMSSYLNQQYNANYQNSSYGYRPMGMTNYMDRPAIGGYSDSRTMMYNPLVSSYSSKKPVYSSYGYDQQYIPPNYYKRRNRLFQWSV
ncbi:hypothetical protein BDB01DRAFT_798887 [Pilobolus umbonatus]|nr:hypothetical protein BDB01DRAFT_798887 [Pilobolus umbonatus]